LRNNRIFYGILGWAYTRDERGPTSARVDVDILKRAKPGGRRKPIPIDQRPPTRAVYEFLPNFTENHEVIALLIMFNRAQSETVIFDENTDKITVIVPFGKRSLRAEFRPKEMRFNGKPCM
jgi:hypothetical protein